MLFSALVDADFLDTEAFMNPQAAVQRQNNSVRMEELLTSFDRYMAGKARTVTAAGLSSTPVNRCRAEVLQACRDKA
jgi:CRISPR-associated endonuclease/helicase Cas3